MALAAAPLVLLAACSGSDTPAGNDGITATATVDVPTTGATGGTGGTEAPTSTTPTAPPTKTETKLSTTIKDPDLGHEIQPLRIVRNVPWPDGSPVSAEAFELVGVEMRLKAGSRYTADLAPWMITLTTPGSQWVQPAPGNEFGTLLGQPLAGVGRGATSTGWVYYKVNRADESTPVTMTFHRPAYYVSTTKKNIPNKGFGAVVVK